MLQSKKNVCLLILNTSRGEEVMNYAAEFIHDYNGTINWGGTEDKCSDGNS